MDRKPEISRSDSFLIIRLWLLIPVLPDNFAFFVLNQVYQVGYGSAHINELIIIGAVLTAYCCIGLLLSINCTVLVGYITWCQHFLLVAAI